MTPRAMAVRLGLAEPGELVVDRLDLEHHGLEIVRPLDTPDAFDEATDVGSGGLATKRGALVLSAGTLASGVLAYAFNVLAARALGPEGYGPIAVLWAAVFLLAVVLFRPLEQTLSREIAERSAHGIDSRPVIRSVVRLGIGITIGMTLICVALSGPITDGLFDGHASLTLALGAGVIGYCLSYLVRGVLGGVRWFGGYGTLLFADGAIRLAVALPLVFVASIEVAALAIVLAAVGGALAPLLAPKRRLSTHLVRPGSAPFELGHVLRFAGPVTAVAVSEQVLVSGGPLLIVLAGGEGAVAAAGVVFAATMLVRAPVFLFQGVSAALLPSLTRLDALGHTARFWRAVLRTLSVLALFSGLLVAGALAVGPEAMHALYGSGFEVSRTDLTVLTAGIGCYLLAATLSQALLARARATAAGAIWVSSAVVFVAVELLVGGSALHRVSVAFAAASLLMTVLFVGLALRDRGSGEPA
ncbi:MAG: lipopolysaccharide biosynthesis protein [Solirubrobacteraceae bacterium]